MSSRVEEKIPHMGEDGAKSSLFETEPTLREDCPDCGGEILVWVHHSGEVGMTQSVLHKPPEKENSN